MNKGNVITAGGNGIEFDAGVDAIALVRNNRISAGDDGVNVRDGDPGHTTGVDSGAYVEISSNQIGSMGSDTIGDDGIDFDDSITGNATVLISGNAIGRSGAKVGDDGIDIDTVTGGATVSIINNTDIRAADNGIEISGPVNGAPASRSPATITESTPTTTAFTLDPPFPAALRSTSMTTLSAQTKITTAPGPASGSTAP